MKNSAKAEKRSQTIHPYRGLALATLVIPVGIVAWIFLWQYGFIASIIAWGMAAGAVWLYQFGAAQAITKAVAPAIIAIILIGVVLAFLGGMVSDGWAVYQSEDIGGTGSITSPDFLSFLAANLAEPELWKSYTGDILISLAFAALGAGGVVYNLYAKKPTANKEDPSTDS